MTVFRELSVETNSAALMIWTFSNAIYW